MFFWLSIAGAAVSLFAVIVRLVYDYKRNGTLSASVKLATIVQTLPALIVEAEKIFGSGNGAAKLAHVLNRVELSCLRSGVEFNADDFSYEVEKILSTPQKKEV